MGRGRAILTVLLAGLGATSAAARPARAQGAAVAAPRLTKAPELVEFVEAEYPAGELAKGAASEVVLQIAIGSAGAVDAVTVLVSGGAPFDEAAVSAARRFVFRPAELDGKPSPVKITYRYRFAPRVVAPTTGTLRGVVLDKRTKRPLAGITVAIDGGRAATTDDRGAFTFDALAPGPVRLTLSRADLTPLQTEETIEAGHALEARYDVELPAAPEPGAAAEDKDDFEVVVVAPRLVKEVVSTEVSVEEARRVPGTQGDVLKVVENLPGVARATAGSGQVVVWGAAPQDTRTYVGAVRVPMLYHFGGLRSVVHNDRVQSVELVPGAYGAAFGRGLGGLVQVTWRDLPKDALHASAQVDVLDAAAAVATPVSDRLRVAVAARRSHVKELGRLVTDRRFEEFFTLPAYHDGQARLHWDLGPRDSVEIGGLFSGDEQSRTQPSNDPSRRVSETRALHFQRYDVAYRHKTEGGAEVDVAPWYGHDLARREGAFGSVPTSLETATHLAGFRAQWRGRLAEEWTGKLGFDAEVTVTRSVRSGSVTSPPREGDPYVFGRPPADRVNADTWNAVIASGAPYGEIDFAPFAGRLHVTPGLRLEPYLVSVDRRNPADGATPDLGRQQHDLSIQPRLATRFALTPRVTYKAAAGFYRQPPLAEDLSAVFGNPALRTSRALHVLTGSEVRILPELTAEATFFHTRSEDLVARNASATPAESEALLGTGEGRSSGAQFLLRKDKGKGRVFGWVAYTLLRSERKDGEASSYRLFDYDQTHVLTALGSYDLGRGFEVGARVRLASGFPRTPVTGTFYDVRRNQVEPTLGAAATTRIPMFLAVDVRVAKRLRLARSELEIYLDVQNVTNRDNPEEIAYSPDYRERRYVLGLPILPALGARWML